MSKINKAFNSISITIIITFIVAILGTYLSDYLIKINWFGDTYYTNGAVKWGARHYWYNITCGSLIFVNLFRGFFTMIDIVNDQN